MMEKNRINEFRERLRRTHAGYDVVMELLDELETDHPHPRPTLGLDWREIEGKLHKDYVADIDAWKHMAQDRYNQLKGIIDILKKQPESQPPVIVGLDWREIEKKRDKINTIRNAPAPTKRCRDYWGLLAGIITTLKKNQKQWVVVEYSEDCDRYSILALYTMKLVRWHGSIYFGTKTEAQAECDRLNGEEVEKAKEYYFDKKKLYRKGIGYDSVILKDAFDRVSDKEKDKILDALNKQARKEGE